MHDKIALIPQRSISTDRNFPLWKKSALVTAAALSLLGMHLDAQALALGAAQVKSFLGEPLRAEVEVPDITSEEAATFQVKLGTPQMFQAAGVDYSQSLRGTRITLNRRPDGHAYLLVEGQQPINEPFLGIVIDASWAKGRVMRNYTLLLDPPRPQAAASAAAPPARQESRTPVVTAPQRRSAFSGEAPQAAAATPGSSAASGKSTGAGERVIVHRGDTATAIIQAHLETHPSDDVSLDQMLLALLHTNPRAFIHGNVNLIRAGAIVNMPSANQAAGIPSATARRMVIAQSRNFHAYRQGLAAAAARGSQITAGPRSATGGVQPQVQETSVAPPPDRLTLSRGSAANQAPGSAGRAETRVAQSRQAKEQATREEELRRNIKELSKLAGASSSAASAPAATAPSSTPGINVPASAAVASVQSPAATATTAAAATAAARQGQKSAPRRPAAPPSESSFLGSLLNLPTLGGLAVIVLLLFGYGFYRSGQKKQKGLHGETRLNSDLFPNSKLPPDSYFGADGGQRVDTSNPSVSDVNSSMAYSPSQLEAVGDVDPVSEADVYLAYGRDAQAEEILHEALRTYPGRSSLYVKLAEIYAKQHDARQLAAIAAEARRVTHGEGHDWQTIVNLGRELDSSNSLYTIDNPPTVQMSLPAQPGAAGNESTQDFGELSDSQNLLDLDLTATKSPPPSSPQTVRQTVPGQFASSPLPVSATFNYVPQMVPAPMSPRPGMTAPAPLAATDDDSTNTMPLSLNEIDFTPPAAPNQPPGMQGVDSEMMEFDPNMFPVDPASQPAQLDTQQMENDPLVTKLALAQEFHAIGDVSSARSLIQEVLAQSTGLIKAKAEQMLHELG